MGRGIRLSTLYLHFVKGDFSILLRDSSILLRVSSWVGANLFAFYGRGVIDRFLRDPSKLKNPKKPRSLGFLHKKSTHELYHFVST